MMHFRAAQRTPATLEEFKGNVLAIETAPFWDDDLSALHDRMERLTDTLDAQFNRTPEMAEEERDQARQKAIAEKFTPEELRRFRSGVSNGGYHYLGAAKIMAPIGKAYADALVASHSGQK
jgi:alpha-galactosidase